LLLEIDGNDDFVDEGVSNNFPDKRVVEIDKVDLVFGFFNFRTLCLLFIHVLQNYFILESVFLRNSC